MKIVFFDLTNQGHHWFYNSELMINLKVKNTFHKIVYITKHISESNKSFLEKKGIIVICIESTKETKKRKYSHIYNLLISSLDYLNAKRISRKLKADIFVNLYFDQYILQYFFTKKKEKNINVLHWFPNNNIKVFILSLLRKSNDSFIVHTNDVKKKLNDINKKINVHTIGYPVKKIKPSFASKEEVLKKLKIDQDFTDSVLSRVLLYFGGTRHDKGLDILLDALKIVESKVTIMIVGQEQTFKKEFIKSKLDMANENSNNTLRLGYVEEADVLKYFYVSDAIILPYRSYFNGESGVLTDAILMEKPVVVPDIIHFPETINKFNNGIVFKVEDAKDLASSIDKLLLNYEFYETNAKKVSRKFEEDRSVENFANQYLALINMDNNNF
ncbi:glycosyltransferase involved in cell wall biosynthesis [Bacillus tianshenii]|uniref:Glycosyltransferase involved in cell wall biosynthesis n=1 Tax=Sutcliffiella tianshenii TaxID=1463404 RepID=A0ABS2NVC8_9BACI|nr:glycosyltransferase family 4 protein [Bacillus tianshenii]MBM7618579.1 glycosyltransferase involved in cell wall biosynthesis [Bacillus tianshenii]